MPNESPLPENPAREVSTPAAGKPPPRLLERMREQIRLRHYSQRTEKSYGEWVRRYVRFHGMRHPRHLGPQHMTAFLSSLANQRNVSASTQNQALAALLFLYREVLRVELPWLHEITRAKRPRRLPVVLTRCEVHAMIGHMRGVHALMAKLMYGTGLRLMECLRLRVKDVELVRREVMVRQGKGAKDRITMFPATLVDEMTEHLGQVRQVYDRDRRARVAGVELPDAYAWKNPIRRDELDMALGFPPGAPLGRRALRHHAGATTRSTRRSSAR